MVNTLSHLGIGLLIASVAGLNSRQIKIVALMAILPDLDFISNALLIGIDQNLSHQMYNDLYYLMGHREFMHSIIFASIVTTYIWFKEKSTTLTIASGAAIFSHVYLDYITSWKMRPLFPFIKDASTLGAIDFFDPVVTVISFIPIIYLLAEHAQKNGKLRNTNSWLHELATGKHETVYRNLLIIFVIWCMFNPIAKALLLDHIEDTEGHSIDYQGSYPILPGKFISAYSHNDTHYRIFTSSYWSGIEKEAYVQKYQGNGILFMEYSSRAKALYQASLPGEIDYPVYNVSASQSNVTVTLSDARDLYAQYWAYFKTEYIFVFENDTGNCQVYIRRNDQSDKPVSINRFE